MEGFGDFDLRIKGLQKLSLEILRQLARSKYKRAQRCNHTITEKHLQELPHVMVYDCTITGDNCARQPKLTKVKEYAYTPQLLMSVYIKMKAFKLTQTINEVFSVVEFESERGGKLSKFHRVE